MNPVADGQALVLGNLNVDLEGREARIGTEPLNLTYQEFELLAKLLCHRDRILPQTRLCEGLWGRSEKKERKRLAVLVARLREKLDGLHPYQIETVRLRGYGLTTNSFAPEMTLTNRP